MAKIRSLQPFEIKQLQPHHLALRWVDAQSKIDKHRLLMPAFLGVTETLLQLGTVPPGIPIEADVVGRERVRLEHDVELLRVTEIRATLPGDPPPELRVQLNAEPVIEPYFGHGLKLSHLDQTCREIRSIAVDGFASNFPPLTV